jgi:hypothetical protein
MLRWLFVVGCTGCSFTLSGPNPKRPADQAPTCDTKKSAVVADAIAASTLGVIAAGVGSGNAVAPLALAAVFVGAAIHGNSVVNACRKDNEMYLAQHRAMPREPEQEDREDRNQDDVAASHLDQPARNVPEPATTATAEPQPPPVQAKSEPQVPAAQSKVEPQPPAPQPKPEPQHPSPPAVESAPWPDFWKEVH